jgi:hypothetical protein
LTVKSLKFGEKVGTGVNKKNGLKRRRHAQERFGHREKRLQKDEVLALDK